MIALCVDLKQIETMETPISPNTEADLQPVFTVYQKVQECDPTEKEFSDLLNFEDSDLEKLVITLS